MCPGSAYIINWNQIDLTKLRTKNGKIVASSPIVAPVPLLSRNVVVSRIEMPWRPVPARRGQPQQRTARSGAGGHLLARRRRGPFRLPPLTPGGALPKNSPDLLGG